ncbi:MAG: hypothetical protein NVSMB46_05610 [Candidatus Saccharimonadales bacterium]
MKVSSRHLAAIIGEKTVAVRDTTQLTKEIASYLLQEKRTADVDSIMRDVMQYRFDHGIIEVTLVSANPLSHADVADASKLVHAEHPKGKTFIINQRIDPRVVGGIRIEYANEQLDLTVQSRISTFKRITSQERSTV